MRRIINIERWDIRPLHTSAPPRGELELAEYGREYLIQSFTSTKAISLPYMCFIDGFGLYRNMYRSLMGIYLILAGMNVYDRTKRANVFPITLGPHGANFEDVIEALQSLQVLDKGVKITVKGEEVFLCAFVLAFLGDMPQQNDNVGIKRQNADRGCRACTVLVPERGDLNYPIIMEGRYHHQLKRQRAYISRISRTAQKAYCQEWGLTENPSPLDKISPCLDLVQSKPSNPAHSEYSGIAKFLQELLFTAILTTKAQQEYVFELQHFKFPPGWGRLQSPLKHLQSWRMQEAARASVITPVLLRMWLQAQHVKPKYLAAISSVFGREMWAQGFSAVDMIVYSYGLTARSNSVILARSMTSKDRDSLNTVVYNGRKAFQNLFEAAAIANSSPASRAPTPASPSAMSIYSNPEAEFEEMESLSASLKVTSKAKQFRAFQSRPNIHIGLHYDAVTQEYATPNNYNILIGEDKHK